MRRQRSASTNCAKCSMPCAGWPVQERRGACCPETFHPGRRSISRHAAGCKRGASRPWSATFARSFAGCKAVRACPVPQSWMDASLQSSCESGPRAGYDGYKRRNGSKVHMAVDALGHLLAVHVTPANEQERAQLAQLCEAVQDATGEMVKLDCPWTSPLLGARTDRPQPPGRASLRGFGCR